jgi:flagellin
MALYIQSNIDSIVAQNHLGVAKDALSTALERISSGLRINHSADDPAGALFGMQMQFQIQGENVGSNNLNMAVDLLNTADSFIQAINSDLTTMASLADQARNALLTNDQRGSLNTEYFALASEINRIATNANYNQKALIDGTLLGVTIQTGFSAADVVTFSLPYALTTANLGITANSISQTGSAGAALSALNSALTAIIAPLIAQVGSLASSWASSVTATNAYTATLSAARARIMNADIAQETTNLTNSQVIVQSGIAALAQANSAQTLALGLLK